MIVFKRASDLSQYLAQANKAGKTIGFVPTMGALHEGHLSLLQLAKNDTSFSLCSIFINPTQFNNKADFDNYPTTIEKDIEKLQIAGCDCLFLPSVAEIYPPGFRAPRYELGHLETMLEGHFRPGHFQGVCQVVDRLLQIIQPDRLYLGQKDYQQCKVIQRLLQVTNNEKTSVVTAPTVREKDGLAMSSRNLRLSQLQRKKAVQIFQELKKAANEIERKQPGHITAEAHDRLEKEGFAVDYFEVRDADTLLPVTNSTQSKVALVAAYLDEIRLIDNLPLN